MLSTAFISSFTIIFRESLEAVLIVAAIYGYLNQIGESSAKKIINYAWISALLFGGLTFIGANYLFHLTAEHAEIVEGVTSIVASLILFQVGVSIPIPWRRDGSLATAISADRQFSALSREQSLYSNEFRIY